MLYEQSFEILPRKTEPFKELCCLFFVQLGNRYIIICSLALSLSLSLSVFVWERLCVYMCCFL